MPCVEITIGGLDVTPQLAGCLEKEITRVMQETIAPAFARGLNFAEGSREFAVALEAARQIMPGWTWVTVVPQSWAVRGQRVGSDAVVARFHILVLAGALPQAVRQQVAQAVAREGEKILAESRKPVQLFVDVIEGEVDMSLPSDLFGALLQEGSHRLLKVDEVLRFMMNLVMRKPT